MSHPLIQIGYVVKAHGIRGALRVASSGDSLLALDRIFVGENEHRVRRVQRERDQFLLELHGVDDRDRAEALKGQPLRCERSQLPDAGKDRLYVADLVGCGVETTSGEPLGQVAQVVDSGAQELLVVRSGERELLLPFVDSIVLSVDVAARKIVCDPPEGLLELNEHGEPRVVTFEILTLFPEMFESVLGGSLLGRAVEQGLLAVHFTDPRQFARASAGGRRQVDDTPYGGGAGMVMCAGPLVAAIEQVEAARGPAHKVLLCPSGRPLDQAKVVQLAAHDRLLLVCGRYEGYDDRVRAFVDEELSIGDYVLTGGELGAMVIVDAVARRKEGVLGNPASALDESFEAGLLEHPQYTRPPVFRELAVPEVLLSGDHEKIRRHRRREALLRTRARRPDLFARIALSDEDRELLGTSS